MLQNIDQIELEQRILCTIITEGIEAYQRLPPNMRATVFSIASHQDIFNVIALLATEKNTIDMVEVAKRCEQKVGQEFIEIFGNVLPQDYFQGNTLEEAANELINRAENPLQMESQSETETGTPPMIDPSHFQPMTASEVIAILGLTIKRDEQNKLITFLGMLSAYTEDSQMNISFNAPSSTGKSYIPMEIARLFPKEDVILVGYCSPTAFFHDVGIFDEKKKGYVIDLSRKNLIFLDQPHTQLLQHLRPLLSHDQKEIVLKITDKSQKSGLRTKNILLRGYPAVIFCTAGLKIDEQETTRFFLLSPEANQEKIRQAISEKIKKEANSESYYASLEDEPDRWMLKERIKAIKQEKIQQINIQSPEKIEQRFLAKNKILKPRHQRDIGRIIGLAKAFAIFNLWFRERNGGTIIANDDDVEAAFKLWDMISQSQEYNLPPYIYGIYQDVIVPLWKEKNGK